MTRVKTAAASALLGAALVGALPAAGAFAARPSAASTALTNVTKQLQKQANAHAIVFGTLTAIGANSATVSTPKGGSLTVNLIAKVRTTPRNQAAAAAGYKTGDQVLILGAYRNGFTGSVIQYDTAAFPTPVFTRLNGKVSTSSSQSLTVGLASNQTSQVQLGTTTRFFLNGKASATAPTFTANEKVVVLAQEQTDGSLMARIVAEGTLTPAKAAVRVAGTITSVASDNASFVLTLANGKTATVTTGTATKYRVNGAAVTTAPAFTPNEKVVVQGTRTVAGSAITIAAKLINAKTA